MESSKRRKATRRSGPPSPPAGAEPESFQPPAPADPTSGTAFIPPVTEAAMDHAAQIAAEMVDAAVDDGPNPSPAVPASAAAVSDEADVEALPVRAASDDHGGDAAVGGVSAATTEAADPVPPAEAANENAATPPPGTMPAPEFGHRLTGGAAAARPGPDGPFVALGRCNAKLAEILGANLAATGALLTALMQAKSLNEVAAINADHVRRQLDAMTTQGRDLMHLVQMAAFDALRPFKDGYERFGDR